MLLLLNLIILKHVANGLSTFPIKDKPVFSNGPRSLPRNFRDSLTLCNRVFDTFILAKSY